MLGARLRKPLLRLGPVAICALTAHAALYRSLFPADGVHGYFGWYEPAVAALSLASAVVIGAAGGAALLGRRSPTLADLRSTPPTALAGIRLAGLAIAWLVTQETIERSVNAGGLEPATFGVGGWSIIVTATAIAAGAVTLVARVGVALVSALVATRPRRRSCQQKIVCQPASALPRRRRALADRPGLRAPPAAA